MMNRLGLAHGEKNYLQLAGCPCIGPMSHLYFVKTVSQRNQTLRVGSDLGTRFFCV